jgi:hypothetical protein
MCCKQDDKTYKVSIEPVKVVIPAGTDVKKMIEQLIASLKSIRV